MTLVQIVRSRHFIPLLLGLTLLLSLWPPLVQALFESDFMSLGHCYFWRPNLVTLHVVSDSLIALAYFTIPFTLLYLVRRRKDLPFNWMFLSFGAFIVACGATHVMEVWTVWIPFYWLSGLIKAITAVTSIVTAIALVKLVPSALRLPSVRDLEEAKRKLELEIVERKHAEIRLKNAHDELEKRVHERTTQLAEANDELRRASRLKDQFLAMLSHELRTPLTAIYGWIHLLQQGSLDQKKTTTALEVISRNVKAQTQLVDDLLQVSRIITGNLKIAPEWTSGVAIVRSCVESIRPAAQNKEIEISESLDVSVDPIYVDSARLQQVLWNLLSNAVKFTPARGRIRVEFGRFDTNVRIAVSDTGEGIDPTFLPQVFDRFVQADPSPTRKYGGMGLGLSIVRHIVEIHGGRVTAQSEGRGRGSTFIVHLPTPAKPPQLRVATMPKVGANALCGLHVMLVEDDLDSREVIAEILENYGASVLRAASATEALTALLGFEPDVLISDIAMPEMDGYALMSSIKEQHPHLPIVALSAYSTVHDRDRARNAGFQAHLSKPIDAHDLITTVMSVVG
jgi:signal transduction histidine kinase/CheY-like chemotaxis protein